jgi:hypothetical protein
VKAYSTCIGILILLAAVVLSPASDALAGRGIGKPGDPHRGQGIFSSLTSEQREAVHARVTEMRENGASREEVHAAVGEMLKSYGIELPEDWNEKPHGRRGPGRRFMTQLTEEQREAVRARVTEMRENGASREETRAVVHEMLKSYGIELPDRREDAPAVGPGASSSGAIPEKLPVRSRNYPNPFNPVTHISYTTDVPGKVKVEIYDVEGHLVRTFREGYRSAGTYGLAWDGRHAGGGPAASGIYFYRIEAGPNSVTNRMILLR